LASSSIIDLTVRRGESGTQSLVRSRKLTLVWGIVLGVLGLVQWGPVLVAGLTIASITYGATLGVFLLGTWNRRANETGALTGFTTGLAAMIAIKFLTPLAWTWYVLVGTVITFAVGSLASMLTSSKRANVVAPLTS
jgi:Na+(H+)/acetate symporter ActP